MIRAFLSAPVAVTIGVGVAVGVGALWAAQAYVPQHVPAVLKPAPVVQSRTVQVQRVDTTCSAEVAQLRKDMNEALRTNASAMQAAAKARVVK